MVVSPYLGGKSNMFQLVAKCLFQGALLNFHPCPWCLSSMGFGTMAFQPEPPDAPRRLVRWWQPEGEGDGVPKPK